MKKQRKHYTREDCKGLNFRVADKPRVPPLPKEIAAFLVDSR